MTPAAKRPDAEQGHDNGLRGLGISQDEIDRKRRRNGPQANSDFKPWPWHLDAMRLFGGMRTQWNAVPCVGGLIYLGLNYAGLATVQDRLGLAHAGPELFDQLQAIERGAITYLNQRVTNPTP